jgi:hypothetical protein
LVLFCRFAATHGGLVFGMLDFDQRDREQGIVIRVMRGRHSETPEGVFQEWAAALQFPYYFGHNWDAFDECIIDLSWLPGSCYVFVVTELDMVLPDHPDEFNIFVRVMKRAHKQWKIPNRANMDEPVAPFTIVFHAEPDKADEALPRLRAAGADPVEARFSDEFIRLTTDRL